MLSSTAFVEPSPVPTTVTTGVVRRKFRFARLTVDAAALAKLLGVGVRTVRTLDYAGKLPRSLRLGARVVWYLPEIRAWLANGAPPREEWEAIREARRRRRK